MCVEINKLRDTLSQETVLTRSLVQWSAICRNVHNDIAKWSAILWFGNVYLRVRNVREIRRGFFICNHWILSRFLESRVTCWHTEYRTFGGPPWAGWLISVPIPIRSKWKRRHAQRWVRTSHISIQDGQYVQLSLLIIWRYVCCNWMRLFEGKGNFLRRKQTWIQFKTPARTAQ